MSLHEHCATLGSGKRPLVLGGDLLLVVHPPFPGPMRAATPPTMAAPCPN
jgi:hypothetical protein